MDVIGAADIGVNERARNAFRDGNVGAPEQLQDPQRVLSCDRGVAVAEGCSQRLELYSGTANGVENRHRVVDSGVDVHDHAARFGHAKILR